MMRQVATKMRCVNAVKKRTHSTKVGYPAAIVFAKDKRPNDPSKVLPVRRAQAPPTVATIMPDEPATSAVV